MKTALKALHNGLKMLLIGYKDGWIHFVTDAHSGLQMTWLRGSELGTETVDLWLKPASKSEL